ncbi:MAG: hypothetical protein ACOYOV_07545 [Bacteroidales bacterium]
MLTIKINDKALAIDPKTKLRFEINSPIFETDAIPGSYICPFDIPVMGNDIFENAEFIEINRIYKKYACMVYLSDFPLFSGELVLNSSNPKRYRCSVILTGIASDFPDKKLNELDYGPDIAFSSLTAYAAAQNNNAGADLVFPVIHDADFYGSSDDDTDSPANPDYGGHTIAGVNVTKTGKFINYWSAELQEFPINEIQPENCPGNDNRFVMVPQLKLIYLVKKIFESLGYSINGDFFRDGFIGKLLFANYFALDAKKKKFFVAAGGIVSQHQICGDVNQELAQKISFPDDSSLGYEDNDNCWNTSTNEYEIKTEGFHSIKMLMNVHLTNINQNHFIVAFYKTAQSGSIFMRSVTSQTVDYNLEINESFYFAASDIGKKIWFNFVSYYTVVYLSAKKLNITSISYANLNQFLNSIHIANHVTSNTVGTVLNALKTNFGLAMWFDAEGKTTEISFLKDVLKSFNSIDITDRVIKDSLEITTEEKKGYKLTQKSDDEAKDVELLTNLGKFMKKTDLPNPDKLNVIAEVLQEGCFYQYKKNETDQTLSWVKYGTSVASVHTGKATNETAMDIGITTNVIMQDRLVPESKQQGSSEFFDTGVNETDMQLLIWHGMNPDKNGHNYPFASALRYALDGSTLSDIELRLDGDHGLFKNFLKEWYDFLDAAEPVKLQMKFGDEMLIKLLQLFRPQANKASQQVRKLKYQGSLLLPKSLSFLIPVSGGFIESELDCLKDGGVEL